MTTNGKRQRHAEAAVAPVAPAQSAQLPGPAAAVGLQLVLHSAGPACKRFRRHSTNAQPYLRRVVRNETDGYCIQSQASCAPLKNALATGRRLQHHGLQRFACCGDLLALGILELSFHTILAICNSNNLPGVALEAHRRANPVQGRRRHNSSSLADSGQHWHPQSPSLTAQKPSVAGTRR